MAVKCITCTRFVKSDEFIKCSCCPNTYHLTCLNLSQAAQDVIGSRTDWQCPDCVVCSVCHKSDQEGMLLCDLCDRGYHMQCNKPALTRSPPGDDWFCATCTAERSKKTTTSKRRSEITTRNRTSNESTKSSNTSLPTSPKLRRVSSPSSRSPRLSEKASPSSSTMAVSPSKSNSSTSNRLSTQELALNKERAEINNSLCAAENYSSVEVPFEELSVKSDLEMFLAAEQLIKHANMEDTISSCPKPSGRLEFVRFGAFELRTWYPSPYPESLASLPTIYVCEFCLKPMASIGILSRHMHKCVWRHPPGNEIYRKGKLSFWEVDGNNAKVYCQNLCLLAKLFLDHKTLYFDVQPFLFYVLTECDSDGCHMVGYFSKEKESVMNCNLSCLLTLPHQQRKGYGQFLIDFSYLLSRVDGRIGSPEHPLSDLGLLAYRYYWTLKILTIIDRIPADDRSISIKQLSNDTGIHTNDIVSTLQSLFMIKNYKGSYVVLRRPEVIKEFLKTAGRKRRSLGGDADLHIDDKALKWQPMTDYSHDPTVMEYIS